MYKNKQAMKLFIVEDNADLREIFRLRFAAAGFEVAASENGLDFLTRVQEEKPDVILLDLMLPEMDGFAVLKSMRENFDKSNTPNVKIIAWSNLSEDTDIQKALSGGANYYLRKSDYEGDDLVIKVKELLNKKTE